MYIKYVNDIHISKIIKLLKACTFKDKKAWLHPRQGQLFFGSMLQLTANLEAAASDSRIEFVILSYGRVPFIDPSAAENIKLAEDKMSKFGCHVIHCSYLVDEGSDFCRVVRVKSPRL